MRIKPMLGDWEIPHIEAIESLEGRSFVELPVPGRVGSLFQDLNTTPTQLCIAGSLYGDDNRDQFLEDIRSRYMAGEPVTFAADIVTATELQYVIIQRLYFQENASRPGEISYVIVVKESSPPPPPDTLGGIDAGLLEDAQGFLDSATGALDMIDQIGSIPDFGDPTPPVREAMDGVRTATGGIQSAATLLGGLFEA